MPVPVRESDNSVLSHRVAASLGRGVKLRARPAFKPRVAFFNGRTRKRSLSQGNGRRATDDFPATEVTLLPGDAPRLLTRRVCDRMNPIVLL
jgi:hypothetical protein